MSDELLSKIYDKVEKISEDVGELKITSAQHEVTLQTHMQASNTLKSLYDDMKKNDIEPLKTEMNFIKGGGKLLGYLGALVSLIVGLIKLFKR